MRSAEENQMRMPSGLNEDRKAPRRLDWIRNSGGRCDDPICQWNCVGGNAKVLNFTEKGRRNDSKTLSIFLSNQLGVL
jgi:hypothetical protein